MKAELGQHTAAQAAAASSQPPCPGTRCGLARGRGWQADIRALGTRLTGKTRVIRDRQDPVGLKDLLLPEASLTASLMLWRAGS